MVFELPDRLVAGHNQARPRLCSGCDRLPRIAEQHEHPHGLVDRARVLLHDRVEQREVTQA